MQLASGMVEGSQQNFMWMDESVDETGIFPWSFGRMVYVPIPWKAINIKHLWDWVKIPVRPINTMSMASMPAKMSSQTPNAPCMDYLPTLG